jgi:hypothetical protein
VRQAEWTGVYPSESWRFFCQRERGGQEREREGESEIVSVASQSVSQSNLCSMIQKIFDDWVISDRGSAVQHCQASVCGGKVDEVGWDDYASQLNRTTHCKIMQWGQPDLVP